MTSTMFCHAESAPCGTRKSLFWSDGAYCEFTVGEGELMAHDVPLGCARMNMMISYQELVRTFLSSVKWRRVIQTAAVSSFRAKPAVQGERIPSGNMTVSAPD